MKLKKSLKNKKNSKKRKLVYETDKYAYNFQQLESC